MQWFYVAGGTQSGPVSEAELAELVRTGQLKPSDYVWNDSMGETWVRAETVAGLFGAHIPPPLPTGLPDEAMAVPGRIGFWAPAQRAWDRMHAMLFRPLNLGKWFLLGVSAWFSTLGEQGFGGSFNPGGGNFEEKIREYSTDPARLMEEARVFLHQHGMLVITIVTIVVLISLAIGLFFMWIRCRGKFMFLDNVIHDRTEIADPWRTFRQHANSLWLWRFVYGLICMALGAILIAVACVTFIMPLYHGSSSAELVVPIALNLAVWIVFAVVSAYISRYLEDFVIPIMYNENLLATEAWARFLALFGDHRGTFLLYGLFYLLLSALAGACVLALVLLTLCIAGCLMMFPYVGSVVLLPMLVFFRLYGVEFLGQFGPEFRMRPRVDAEA